MAEPTASVKFGTLTFSEGTQVFDESLGATVSAETYVSRPGGLLGKALASPKRFRINGVLVGDEAAGPRAGLRRDLDELVAAFMRDEGDWLYLWSDRRVWAKCERCEARPASTALSWEFDVDMVCEEAFWKDTTPVTLGGTMDGGVGNWGTVHTEQVTLAGTAPTPMLIRFQGRVATTGGLFVNRFNNLLYNSGFDYRTAADGTEAAAGIPAGWTALNGTATGIDYMSPARILRRATSTSTDASGLTQDCPFTEPGAALSAGCTFTIEDYSGTHPKAWLEMQWLDSGGSVISTETSAEVTTEHVATAASILNKTAPANTASIRIRLMATVDTGGSIAVKCYRSQLARGATLPTWLYNSRKHERTALNHNLLPNEEIVIDSEARTALYRALNANDADASAKLVAGWQFPTLQPGVNELLVQHNATEGTGYLYFGSNWHPRYWTP